jgi:hypothetical protein
MRRIHLRFPAGVDAMQSIWPIRADKSSIFHDQSAAGYNEQNRSRAIQLAGSAVEGSLDLDLLFLFLSSFPAMAACSLSR